MKVGDYARVADKTAYRTLYEGSGILVRPDDGRTYVKWSNSWEVFCEDGIFRVIDGAEIEVISTKSPFEEIVEAIDEYC